MNKLIRDAIIKICDLLCDYDRLNFLSISTKHDKYKQHIYFDEEVPIKRIIGLSYFNRFRNVFVSCIVNKLPPDVTHLKLSHGCDENIFDNLPNTVTDLILDLRISRNIKGCIPANVKRLRMTDAVLLNQCDLNGRIPEKVTHLFLGRSNLPVDISNCIPKSVKHLEINMGLIPNQNIELHEGLTHLAIGEECLASFRVPYSVMQLVLPSSYANPIIPYGNKYLDICRKIKNIPSSVTHLTYRSNTFDDITSWVPSSVTHYTHYSNSHVGCYNDNGYRREYVPSGVTHLTLPDYNKYCSLRKIPTHVEHVTYRHFDSNMDEKVLEWEDIPSHIKSVTIGMIRMVR
uniref:FNIP repeat-containing protein n=1 Tax=viral metagenome TaxID=1070528 RepID=A0A6C0C9P1_9ZZZZ